jgi:hypothetical protein
MNHHRRMMTSPARADTRGMTPVMTTTMVTTMMMKLLNQPDWRAS